MPDKQLIIVRPCDSFHTWRRLRTFHALSPA